MFDRQQSITRAVAVDLSSTDYTPPTPTRAVFVGTAGNLIVELVGNPGAPVTYAVQAGTRHSLSVSKIIRTNTTAGGIVAEF